MADTDSPLSTTASVIAILTLVYAIGISLSIYAKAVYQSERNLKSLARRVEYGESALLHMRDRMLREAEREGLYGGKLYDRKEEEKSELKVLAKKLDVAHQTWEQCTSDWQQFMKLSADGSWGVFGTAPFAPISDPILVLAVWPAMIEHRAIPWIAVRTLATMVYWCVGVSIFLVLAPSWLAVALLYDAVVLCYNGLVWMDLRRTVQRIRWATAQGDIANRMQEVESSISDLRVQVLLRLLERSQHATETVHDHLHFLQEKVMSAIADPGMAKRWLDDRNISTIVDTEPDTKNEELGNSEYGVKSDICNLDSL
ncbi:hypothetical protein BDV95DRAFT_596492 [Massariosphaeria phaeospora]|uniref:Uncharacterized protein n=1 Tax=Massariosphaeria phaeospora TaxID=100035 RepID=A0A7C8M6Z3_9PLEO|nr:hypothetical protein BDV95DRAFT_596492 [Massariosphaeria phaeospora]